MLLTTRTYDSHEAVEDANQVNDILVLPLTFEELRMGCPYGVPMSGAKHV